MNAQTQTLEITITVRTKEGQGEATEQMTCKTHYGAKQALCLIMSCIRQQLEPHRKPGW